LVGQIEEDYLKVIGRNVEIKEGMIGRTYRKSKTRWVDYRE
jgi:hypothetical protein